MICDHNEHFQVTISVQIRKHRDGTFAPGETITYSQEFGIAARGFQGVAKILGDLDTAVGSIDKCAPRVA